MTEEILKTDVPAAVATEVKTAAKGKADKTLRTAKGKKRVARAVPQGRAYIHASYNNTIVTVTDMNGNTIAWSSAGNCGFKGPKKATPYAASMIVKKIAEQSAQYALKDLLVFVTGIGNGRDGALRALNANGFNVVAIKDLTPVAHNGCRPRRARRV